jgi:hypothetical protein
LFPNDNSIAGDPSKAVSKEAMDQAIKDFASESQNPSVGII